MNQRRPGRAAAKPIRAFRLVMPSRIALFCAVCTLGVAVRSERGGVGDNGSVCGISTRVLGGPEHGVVAQVWC